MWHAPASLIAAALVVLLAGLVSSHAQQMPADTGRGAGAAVRAPLESAREVSPEEVVQSVAVRKQRLRAFYDEWQRKALEAGPPPEQRAILDAKDAEREDGQ